MKNRYMNLNTDLIADIAILYFIFTFIVFPLTCAAMSIPVIYYNEQLIQANQKYIENPSDANYHISQSIITKDLYWTGIATTITKYCIINIGILIILVIVSVIFMAIGDFISKRRYKTF